VIHVEEIFDSYHGVMLYVYN